MNGMFGAGHLQDAHEILHYLLSLVRYAADQLDIHRKLFTEPVVPQMTTCGVSSMVAVESSPNEVTAEAMSTSREIRDFIADECEGNCQYQTSCLQCRS